MERSGRPVVVFVVCLFITGCLIIMKYETLMEMNPIYGDVPSGWRQFQRLDSAADKFEARMRHFRRTCANATLFAQPAYTFLNKPVYLHSSGYNFSYCKVPKIASTFWTQALYVLKHGAKNASGNIFNRKRSSIHGIREFATKFNDTVNSHSRSVIVSRDPYSRLYSAYVDKIYLPNMAPINNMIKRRALSSQGVTPKDPGCPGQASFEDFIQYVIRIARRGIELDRHWAPISALCRPCEVHAFFIGNQETFTEDVTSLLQRLNVEDAEFQAVVDALNSGRIKSTLPGIVHTVMDRASKNDVLISCYGIERVMEKLWVSFQIQGYIHNDVPFPRGLTGTNDLERSKENLINKLNEAVRERPLTRAESKAQRRQALVRAYRAVSEKSIRDIQELYKQDFQLFGYDQHPPS